MKRPDPRLALAALALTLSACAGSPDTAPADGPAPTIVRAADVEWQPLNPARGDASPRAATLWGDRDGDGPTGFLVRFADGFSSPPHIHNVSYRGVVVRGLVHNADAAAEPMWMPTGSFWTQPKGGAHITAARGESVAYIEIDEGPYLVRPVDAAFSAGEVPLNLHAANIVWVPATPVGAKAGPQHAFLWGAPGGGQPAGYLVRLPPSSGVVLGSGEAELRAVLVDGRVSPPETSSEPLDPGSALTGEGSMQLWCEAQATCLLYVGTAGPLTVHKAQ